jgi:hypothetical protein
MANLFSRKILKVLDPPIFSYLDIEKNFDTFVEIQ